MTQICLIIIRNKLDNYRRALIKNVFDFRNESLSFNTLIIYSKLVNLYKCCVFVTCL